MKKGILKIVEGDVTNPQRTAPNEIVFIPHCCNTLGVMGAGVALALRKKWGKVFNAYEKMKTKYIGIDKYFLGDISYVPVEYTADTTKVITYVVNMIGQDGIVSADNPKPVKYYALMKAMNRTKEIIERIVYNSEFPSKDITYKPVIHCPKFGSKLAGGNFDFILELIKEIWIDAGIDVVIYEYNG